MIRFLQTFRQQSFDERAAPKTADDLFWGTVPYCFDVKHLITELKVLAPKLPGSGGDDAGTRRRRGSVHDHAMGSSVRARA
jgi:hypothetical protein